MRIVCNAKKEYGNNRITKEPRNCSKMNERIENTYTRSGRIANPTEQVKVVVNLINQQN